MRINFSPMRMGAIAVLVSAFAIMPISISQNTGLAGNQACAADEACAPQAGSYCTVNGETWAHYYLVITE